MHAASNFPARKQRSDLDIGLADGTGDGEYLQVVSEALMKVLGIFKPNLVLYDAGRRVGFALIGAVLLGSGRVCIYFH